VLRQTRKNQGRNRVKPVEEEEKLSRAIEVSYSPFSAKNIMPGDYRLKH
jgi:hypothetical protein